MPDRQEIIATNKSLRLIKNELEHLLEKGVITDEAFDTFHSLLPAEASLAGSTSHAATPSTRSSAVASPPPPTSAMAALNVNPTPSPAPPAYNTTGPPSLPGRNQPPPPPPPAAKPVIAHAKALYKYTAADDRDLSFERDDRIAVHEYMNDDWWMGRNLRTNAEGIFPKNYVEIDRSAPPPGPPSGPNGYYDEKAAGAGYYPGQPSYAQPPMGAGGYPPAPPPGQNPYNSNVPPMAVAAEGSGQPSSAAGGKTQEYGKKFGKKLGNAAIFGAGATIGGNIVNSIF